MEAKLREVPTSDALVEHVREAVEQIVRDALVEHVREAVEQIVRDALAEAERLHEEADEHLAH